MVATLEEVQESAGEIQSLLADYREVLDSHLAEFLEEQAWRLVPMEWTTHLGSLSEEDLARAAQGQLCETAPQSLRDFAARCRACTVAKQSRTSESRRSERPWMGKKKAHEAAALADIVEAEAREEGATCVVEVGAGKGNLCGELRDRGIGVAAMEANQSLAQSIIDRAAANSVAEGLDVSSPGDIAAESMDKAALDGEGSYIVAALHAREGDVVAGEGKASEDFGRVLGSQSPTLLRGFMESERAARLALVGCCYNLVSEEADEGGACIAARSKTKSLPGFPMSSAFQSTRLGHTCRNLACQGSLEGQKHPGAATFCAILARAGLQGMAKRNGIEPARRVRARAASKWLRRQPNQGEEEFAEFARQSFTKSGFDAPCSEEARAVWREKCEPVLPHLRAFLAMRALLSGPVEAAIHMDRLAFLLEHGIHNASIQPIFHHGVSPRNIAVLARKQPLSKASV